MPITLKKLNGGDKSLAIPCEEGETLNVVYSRADYTPKLEAEMEEVRRTRPGHSLALMLGKVLRSWDVVDDDDSPVPLSAQTLDERLAIEAQAKIVEALAEDQRPNATASDGSDDTF